MADARKTLKKVGERKKPSTRRPSSSRRKRPHTARWKQVLAVATVTAFALFCTYHLFLKQIIYRFSPCNGIKIYNTCMPKGYSVFGIDISHHQGNIDWEEFGQENPAETPIRFVYMKATEGSDHKDTRFDENWSKAKEHNFLRGAYHYFSTTSTGLAQANMFIENVKREKGDLPPMVDVEEIPENRERFIEELKIFIARIEEHYGVLPIIYSGKNYKEKYLDDKFFDRFPTWIAHYYAEQLEVKSEWLIWQCTDKGEIPGINHQVDINVFNGELQQLNELVIK